MDSFLDALKLCSPSNASFSVDGDSTYSNVIWLSSNVEMPTEAQVLKKKQELDDALPMKKLREKRDKLLALSDVYMITDFPLTDEEKLEVRNYRQALRDLPSSGQTEFPVLNLTK